MSLGRMTCRHVTHLSSSPSSIGLDIDSHFLVDSHAPRVHLVKFEYTLYMIVEVTRFPSRYYGTPSVVHTHTITMNRIHTHHQTVMRGVSLGTLPSPYPYYSVVVFFHAIKIYSIYSICVWQLAWYNDTGCPPHKSVIDDHITVCRACTSEWVLVCQEFDELLKLRQPRLWRDNQQEINKTAHTHTHIHIQTGEIIHIKLQNYARHWRDVQNMCVFKSHL